MNIYCSIEWRAGGARFETKYCIYHGHVLKAASRFRGDVNLLYVYTVHCYTSPTINLIEIDVAGMRLYEWYQNCDSEALKAHIKRSQCDSETIQARAVVVVAAVAVSN